MSFELQPCLENELVRLQPLEAEDFADLYAVAADPLLWEQHPNKDRYQPDVFRTFFARAMTSGGAFCIFDRASGDVIGSSRFYDLDETARTVSIGYTFIARRLWGQAHNRATKTLMLGHAFRFVDRALFAVGEHNLRSRRAMEKLGGIFLKREEISYNGEPSHPNVIYAIDKADWPLR